MYNHKADDSPTETEPGKQEQPLIHGQQMSSATCKIVFTWHESQHNILGNENTDEKDRGLGRMANRPFKIPQGQLR